MTETARVYGGSLYELAQEEHLEEEILSEMKEIRALFRENPEYPRLLSEPSIPRKERIGLIDAAFGSQAEPYLVNFIKLLCEKNLLREFGGCQEQEQMLDAIQAQEDRTQDKLKEKQGVVVRGTKNW